MFKENKIGKYLDFSNLREVLTMIQMEMTAVNDENGHVMDIISHHTTQI
jgi:hypothetical protein